MATTYRIDMTPDTHRADLADALAHSAQGRIVAQDSTWARIEVADAAAASYLTQLCDEDDRVLSCTEIA